MCSPFKCQCSLVTLLTRLLGVLASQVVWQTEDHYEPVLTCESAEGVVVKGLRLKHASPSVANNYAVFLQVLTYSAAASLASRSLQLSNSCNSTGILMIQAVHLPQWGYEPELVRLQCTPSRRAEV